MKLDEKDFPEEFQKEFEIMGRSVDAVKGLVAGLGSAQGKFLNLRILHLKSKKQWEIVGNEDDIKYLSNCLFKKLYQEHKDKIIDDMKKESA